MRHKEVIEVKLIKGCAWVGLWSLGLMVPLQASPITQDYLTSGQYSDALNQEIYEDRGIVLENYPKLGYMVYRNGRGEEVTAQYYSAEMTVEKQPYNEQEDKVGYIDQMFPSFAYDSRDTTIASVLPGDNVYLRMDEDGYITYIGAYNDYTVRYGRVHTWTLGATPVHTLVLEDTSGKLHTYEIPIQTPITKAHQPYSLGQLKEGEWVRVLVSQKILGYGMVEEDVKEIVVDPDSRVISDIKKGELLAVNPFQNTLQLEHAQTLHNGGWSPYVGIENVRINPRNLQSYFLGKPVSYDFIQNRLVYEDGYVYAAVESFMGGEQAVKLNFQSKHQATLEPSQIIYTSPGVIKLLSGEQIYLSDDAIVVRDDRLVGPAGLMVGDTLQAVVSGEHKLAVGRVIDETGQGGLEIFRGRIKKIDELQSFEVETYSMLQDGEWYFHPVGRTFGIDGQTRLYTEEGAVSNINEFLDYGATAQDGEVYTVIAQGGHAQVINAMPYTKEAVRGYVHQAEDGAVTLSDVKTYNDTRERWVTLSGGNQSVSVTSVPNTVVIKAGELVAIEAIEVGDELTIMMVEDFKTQNEEGGEDAALAVEAQIIIVE